MNSGLLIRDYVEASDLAGLRQCVVELQDHERVIDPRMPPGNDIADAYIGEVLERCEECAGKILVALVGDEIAGYASILTKVHSDSLDDGNIEYGLIGDLVVLDRFRGNGIGRKLIAAAEAHARACGVRWLRLCVLDRNAVAKQLYRSAGFSELYVDLEKKLK